MASKPNLTGTKTTKHIFSQRITMSSKTLPIENLSKHLFEPFLRIQLLETWTELRHHLRLRTVCRACFFYTGQPGAAFSNFDLMISFFKAQGGLSIPVFAFTIRLIRSA